MNKILNAVESFYQELQANFDILSFIPEPGRSIFTLITSILTVWISTKSFKIILGCALAFIKSFSGDDPLANMPRKPPKDE